tara:strand:+ start:209 stop:484 length:276 start_codon:yes stop_codon:yes gene_type:complete
MKSKVWKHHVAEHFINGSLSTDGGAAAGSTVFTDYDKMIGSLITDPRDWYVAELEVDKSELDYNFKKSYLATILVNRSSKTGFKPLNILGT